MRHAARRRHKQQHIGQLHRQDAPIVAALNHFGAYITTLGALESTGIVGSIDLAAAGRSLFDAGAGETSARKSYVQMLPRARIFASASVPEWGAAARLLDIAEHYIGLPVVYRSILARRDLADGQQMETRYWHTDGEDVRILKIIVYLSDVGPEDGPFCFVPKPRAPTQELPRFDGSRVTDAAFDRAVPPAHQIACTGPAGTVVFVDTCSVWHRGAIGRAADRYTLFYAYNSTTPLIAAMRHSIAELAAWSRGAPLSARQRAAIIEP